MYSPVGFGVYGDEPTVSSAVTEASLVTVTSPSELKGAKITAGLSLKKEGDGYRVGVELPLAGFVGLHTIKGDEEVTVSLPVPSAAKAILGDSLALKYIPPSKMPLDPKLLAAIGLGIVVLFLLMRKKK